ncbi:hypothetical protein LCGC14_0392630 [marine sediment metagenome]|uniref:Uncharacterized protein n=1 Tax=marine sediment metagenome TaxID=412755 RepID=A0A0F9TGZ6_9ZZZZ
MERWSDGSPAPSLGLVKLDSLRGQPTVNVVMVIRVPKGECRIFNNPKLESRVSRQIKPALSLAVLERLTNNRCEAVRAFMEEHGYD